MAKKDTERSSGEAPRKEIILAGLQRQINLAAHAAPTLIFTPDTRHFTRERRTPLPGMEGVLFLTHSSTDISVRGGDSTITHPALVTRVTADGIS